MNTLKVNTFKKYLLLSAVLYAGSASAADAGFSAEQQCAALTDGQICKMEHAMTPEARKLEALISNALKSVKPKLIKRAGIGFVREVVKIGALIACIKLIGVVPDEMAPIFKSSAPLLVLLNDLGDELKLAPQNQTVESFAALQKYIESLSPSQQFAIYPIFKKHATELHDKLAQSKDNIGIKLGRGIVGIIDILFASLIVYNHVKESKYPYATIAMSALLAEIGLVGKNLYFTADHKKAEALKSVEAAFDSVK